MSIKIDCISSATFNISELQIFDKNINIYETIKPFTFKYCAKCVSDSLWDL